MTKKAEKIENLNLTLTPEQAEYLRESITNCISMYMVTYQFKAWDIANYEVVKQNDPESYTEAAKLEHEKITKEAEQLDIAISRAWVIEQLVYNLLQLPLPERKSNEEIIAEYIKLIQDGNRTHKQDAAVSEDSEVLSTESKD